MSRYGIGLIAITVFVVGAAATHLSTSNDAAMHARAPDFSDEERGRIFDGVMRISDAPVTEMVVAPEVADSLPQEVPMQELPTDIVREIPLVRGHKFVKFDDRF